MQGLDERLRTPRVKELVGSMCTALPYEAATALLSNELRRIEHAARAA